MRPSTRSAGDRGVVLAAGAGTGKTYNLVRLALRLYAGASGEPLDPTRVWAVTFTEKAAAELLARITARVRALASGDVEDGLPELPSSRWAEIARALPSAPVGTFHGLCAGLLREHAGEAGVDPGFQVLQENAALELLERAREEVLLEELSDPAGAARRLARDLGGLWALRQALHGLHLRLVEEGRDAASLVRDADGNLLLPFRSPAEPTPAGNVPAGNVPAGNVVVLATRRGDPLAAACSALSLTIAGLASTTHERLAAQRDLIERERGRLGRCDPARLTTWYPAAAALATTSAGRGSLPREAKPAWDDFKDAWERVRDGLAAQGQARVGVDLAGLLERMQARYAASKREIRALDFGDLVRGARDLLRDHLDVRRALKARTAALLVDEFQDTNGVQLDVVHLLGEERSQERPVARAGRAADLPLEPGVLCAVGDRKQSIYEFRGADVSLFAQLIDRARAGDGFELRTLQESRRSLPGIVRFVNQVVGTVLGENRMRSFEVGFREDEDALRAVRPEEPGAGYPAVELLESDPTLPAAERRPLEAALVARHVAMLLAGEREVELQGQRRPLRGSDVVVLLRAFSSVEQYRRALADRGVPSRVVRGRGFFGMREVRDLSALLLALADPRDTFASAAVLRSPLVGISDDALVLLASQGKLALAAHAGGCAAELPEADARKLQVAGPLVARLAREIDRLGPDGVLAQAIDALGYEPVLAAAFEGEQRIANVRKLLAWIGARRGAGALALAQELLARADDRDDREPPPEAPALGHDAVHVMTIHAAKGLEYPVVVVPELGFTDPPAGDAVLFDRELGLAVRVADPLGKRHLDPHGRQVLDELEARRDAESARLLYVAATRARDLLVLCGEGKGRSWRPRIERALEGTSGLVVRIPLPPPDELVLPAAGAEAPAVPELSGERAEEARTPASAPARGKRRAAAGQLDLFAAAGPHPPPTQPPLPAPAASAIPALVPLRLAPGRFVSSVTGLSDLLRCERRFFFNQIAGLEEHPARATPAGEDPDDLDRLERGQLAHRLLETVDLGWAAQDPAGAVTRALERDPARQADEAPAIAADVRALLESPFGRALSRAPRVWREMPFVLEVEDAGAHLVLRGQIDLMFVDAEGTVNVVDHKHASASGQPADAYDFQLATYALAASRVLPEGSRIRTGLTWLRDRGAAPVLREVLPEDLAAHERALGGCAGTLSRIRDTGHHAKLAGPDACGDCGHRRRCWGTPSP